MKKFLAAGIGVLFILCILLFTSDSNNKVRAGNEITEFEYEYYYNDNITGDADMRANKNPAIKTQDKNQYKKTNSQDTKEDSSRNDKQENKQNNKQNNKQEDEQDNKQNSKQEDKQDNKQNNKKENNNDKQNNELGLDTEPDSISVFVNKEYALPESYIPDNLVVPDIKFYGSGTNEKNKLRQEAAEALEKMFSEAQDDNIILYGVSGYRSYARQKEIYDKNVRMRGSQATNKVSAAPGHSEHQTGLAMDISSKALGGRLTEQFGNTTEGRWVAENCYQYGFIIRYPENMEQITGYSYEPWHLRYVGTEISEYIHSENITLEEYYGYTLDEYYLDNIISDSGTNE